MAGHQQESRVSTVHVWCRYEGKDWRDVKSWDCDGDRELLAGMESNFAALQDAMFIPGKEGVLQTSEELIGVAQAYERWMEQQVCVRPESCSHMTSQAVLVLIWHSFSGVQPVPEIQKCQIAMAGKGCVEPVWHAIG